MCRFVASIGETLQPLLHMRFLIRGGLGENLLTLKVTGRPLDIGPLHLNGPMVVAELAGGLTAGGDDYVTKPLSTFPGRTTHERGPVRNYRRRPRPANSQIGTVTVHADWLGLARRPSRELVTCGAVGIVRNVAG